MAYIPCVAFNAHNMNIICEHSLVAHNTKKRKALMNVGRRKRRLPRRLSDVGGERFEYDVELNGERIVAHNGQHDTRKRKSK